MKSSYKHLKQKDLDLESAETFVQKNKKKIKREQN